MRFWDSSALVPLILEQPQTPQATPLHDADPEIVAWWTSGVECISAITRTEREDRLIRSEVTEALRRLDALAEGWHEIQPIDRVRQIASRLLRVHALRAADALQLAAAAVAAEERPSSLPFVTFDQRLAVAAEREGFPVLTAE